MSMSAFDYFQVPEAREELAEEKFYRERGFEEIIGRSLTLRLQLRLVEIVAPSAVRTGSQLVWVLNRLR